LAEIYFDWNRDRLKADAGHIVEHTADLLQQDPTSQIDLQAICDERGTEAYSLTLGWQRVSLIKDYLKNLGISSTQITPHSYGTQPACKHPHKDCKQANRSRQEAFRLLAMTSTRAGCFVTFSLQNHQATNPAANYPTRKPFLQRIHLAESQ